MELSGTSDFQNLINAVVAFINQLNPSTTDTRGAQIGIARFAGQKCQWRRGYTVLHGSTPVPAATSIAITGGDGDTNIDLAGTSEYVAPCTDDYDLLTNLTNNKANLDQDRGRHRRRDLHAGYREGLSAAAPGLWQPGPGQRHAHHPAKPPERRYDLSQRATRAAVYGHAAAERNHRGKQRGLLCLGHRQRRA